MNDYFDHLNWNYVKTFLATAESGSLSAAAKALNTSQPTVGRQITALEEELKIALFERSGRGPELTPGGLELLEYVREMRDAANRFAVAAAGKSETIRGTVAITTTDVAAAFILPPIIERLQKEEPEIEIELIAQNSTSDLKRREADIALRGYRPTQGDLITKKVHQGSAGLYASHKYLDHLGGVGRTEDLMAAKFITFDRNSVFSAALNAIGLEIDHSHFPLFSESHLVQWELVKQGAGIGIMANELGQRESSVTRVLPNEVAFPYELWLTAHRELRTSLRIRRVYDFLSKEMEAFSANSMSH